MSHDDVSAARRAIDKFLLYTDWDWYRGVRHWNDEPGRTHAEVLAVLDRVIAEVEAEQRAGT